MDRTACTEPQCLYKGALYLFFYHAFGETNQGTKLYALLTPTLHGDQLSASSPPPPSPTVADGKALTEQHIHGLDTVAKR